MSEVVHACPPKGSSLTGCCGRTPFELPVEDRLTTDPLRVNCPMITWQGQTEDGQVRWCCTATPAQLREMQLSLAGLLEKVG